MKLTSDPSLAIFLGVYKDQLEWRQCELETLRVFNTEDNSAISRTSVSYREVIAD